MTRIIIVRHSIPEQNPAIPAHHWGLNAKGRQLASVLGAQLQVFDVKHVFTSEEPKAIETGQAIAQILQLACNSVADLGETKRETADFFSSQEDFKTSVLQGFQNPEQVVYGDESFADARRRFCQQIERLAHEFPNQTIIAVTHGRVMSMYLGWLSGSDGSDIWVQLKMPCYAIIEMPNHQLITLIDQINEESP